MTFKKQRVVAFIACALTHVLETYPVKFLPSLVCVFVFGYVSRDWHVLQGHSWRWCYLSVTTHRGTEAHGKI